MDYLSRIEDVIETPSLRLHHLSVNDLVTLFEDPDDMSIYENKEYSNPYRHLMDDKGPLHWRVPIARQHPEQNRWFLRLVVLKGTNEIIGSTSFHAAPDENGMIEIGLGIEEAFRNKGYGKECVMGMWRWGIQDPSVKVLRYTVSISNAPSIHIIEGFGFHYQGEQMDLEDGPESIYEMGRDEFLEKFCSVADAS